MKQLLAAAILLTGCATYEPAKSPYVDTDSRPDLASYVERADGAAQQVLREHNREVKVRLEREPQLSSVFGEYSLSEYEKRVAEIKDPHGNSCVSVLYRLTTPHIFLGHPSEFVVVVYKASGETKVLGGL